MRKAAKESSLNTYAVRNGGLSGRVGGALAVAEECAFHNNCINGVVVEFSGES